MDRFETKRVPKLLFGAGVVSQLGEVIQKLGGRKVLLVTDPGVAAAGHGERAVALLEKNDIQVCYYDGSDENPTEESVKLCVDFVRSWGDVDNIIGFGGGSSMDTAKGVNFILTNGGSPFDYVGYGNAKEPMLPFVAVPTTAGTGSECQAFALIADTKTHMKRALGDPKAMAQVAILDPELTMTAPSRVMKCTGMDALAHALESLVSTRANAFSRLYSKEAFRLIYTHFERVIQNESDVEARGGMLLGAAYAGLAIENSMLGCAHSCANPFTAKFDVVHGMSVGIMLPEVMKLNAEEVNAKNLYEDLELAEEPGGVIGYVERMIQRLGFHQELNKITASMDDIECMAEMAGKQWTAQFNPRPFKHSNFVTVYENILKSGEAISY